MRYLLASVCLAHGVAHFVGTVASWKPGALPDFAYKTTIIGGRFDVGDAGVRVLGALWLFAGLMFLIVAAGFTADTPWAVRLALISIGISLGMCTIGWPDASIGLWLNLLLAMVIVAAIRLEWLVLAS
jgi:hypothetical protein